MSSWLSWLAIGQMLSVIFTFCRSFTGIGSIAQIDRYCLGVASVYMIL